MPPLSTPAFGRRFRALSGPERLAFLAAVWEARGYDARVDRAAGVVVARHPGDGSDGGSSDGGAADPVRIAALGRLDWRVPDADVYVGLRDGDRLSERARGRDAAFRSPADLRDRLLYGLDRGRADRIARDHLGGPLTVPERPTPDRRAPAAATTGVVVAALLVVAVASASGAGAGLAGLFAGPGAGDVLGGPAGSGGPGGGSPSAADGTAPTPSGDAPNGSAGLVATDVGEMPGGDDYPPGVGPDGVTDLDALLSAHRSGVAGRQRAITSEYAGPAETELLPAVTSHEGSAAVHSATAYRRTVRETETHGNWSVRYRSDAYADGGTAYTRRLLGDRSRYSRRNVSLSQDLDGYEAFLVAAAERGLRGADTDVERVQVVEPSEAGGALATEYRTLYRIRATGGPAALPAERFEATADVTADGRIVRFSMSYAHAESGDAVAFRFGYSRFGDVPPPDEPSWVDRARWIGEP